MTYGLTLKSVTGTDGKVKAFRANIWNVEEGNEFVVDVLEHADLNVIRAACIERGHVLTHVRADGGGKFVECIDVWSAAELACDEIDEPDYAPSVDDSNTDEITRADVYELAVEILNLRCDDEAAYRDDYSGRAMYGDTCEAIVSNCTGSIVGWAICEAFAELAEQRTGTKSLVIDHGAATMQALNFIPRRTDSMGMGTVWY